MKIGIIGAGQIGGTLTRRLRPLGHEVHVANSRDPRTLASLVTETGAVAVEAKDAPRGVDLVIVTIPECNVATLPKGLFVGVPASVVVVDTGNYYPRQRDGRIVEIESECRKAAGSNRNWNGPLSKRLITSMRAICSNAVGLVDRLVELPCPLRVTMQRPRPSSCSLSMNSVSMLSMPADWTTPGGSNPEHRCTPPTSMLKVCGRHFRRHAANARPIGRPRPKAPATLPIRRERRLRQSRQCVGEARHDMGPSPLTAFFCGDIPISLRPTCVRGADPSAPQHRYAPRHARRTPA